MNNNKYVFDDFKDKKYTKTFKTNFIPDEIIKILKYRDALFIKDNVIYMLFKKEENEIIKVFYYKKSYGKYITYSYDWFYENNIKSLLIKLSTFVNKEFSYLPNNTIINNKLCFISYNEKNI